MALLTHLNLAAGFRGGERQTELLIRGLAALGWTQQLVARRGEPLAARCRGIPRLTLIETALGVPGAVASFGRAGLVHCHEGRGVQAAWLNAKIRSTPYVITRRVQKGPRRSALNRRMYRDAACVVALSESIRGSLAALDPALPVTVIPSAGSGMTARPGAAERLRARFGGRFIVGHVGALDDSHKGQLAIIEVAARVRESLPDARFVLVGSGRDEARLREAASGSSNVVFTGQVDDVAEHLAAFDLFLFPSRHEGLGSILIDALAAGLPVVATRVGGIPEIVTDGVNGVLVPAGDADALETAVRRLHADEALRRRFSAASRERALEFTPAAMTTRYAALYRELAKPLQPGLTLP